MAVMKRIQEMSMPRSYFNQLTEKPEQIELIGFCDSSERAYAAVVYARIKVNDKVSCNLAMSKSRVAPLSRLTIPRLELLSCLILARLIITVRGMLHTLISVEILQSFTDSISALYWIKGSSKEWKLFVENRVQEIRQLVHPDI